MLKMENTALSAYLGLNRKRLLSASCSILGTCVKQGMRLYALAGTGQLVSETRHGIMLEILRPTICNDFLPGRLKQINSMYILSNGFRKVCRPYINPVLLSCSHWIFEWHDAEFMAYYLLPGRSCDH
jgi:hypothetical protein